jgi:hypothetical protein
VSRVDGVGFLITEGRLVDATGRKRETCTNKIGISWKLEKLFELLKDLLAQLPSLLVVLGCMIFTIVRWKRHPKVSAGIAGPRHNDGVFTPWFTPGTRLVSALGRWQIPI